MRLLHSTPIMLVDRIEPHLPMWRDRLGYHLTAEVPHGDGLGFVILERDGHQLMLQTHASAAEDLPDVGKRAAARGVAVFHVVDDLDAWIKCLEGLEVIGGPRTASYGMREIFVVDSAGYVHGYAQELEKKE